MSNPDTRNNYPALDYDFQVSLDRHNMRDFETMIDQVIHHELEGAEIRHGFDARSRLTITSQGLEVQARFFHPDRPKRGFYFGHMDPWKDDLGLPQRIERAARRCARAALLTWRSAPARETDDV